MTSRGSRAGATGHGRSEPRPRGPLAMPRLSTLCDCPRLLKAKQRLRLCVRTQLRRTDAIHRPADGLVHTGRRAHSEPIIRRVRERTHTLCGPDDASVGHRHASGITQVQVPNSDGLLWWRRFRFGGEAGAGDAPVSTQQARDRPPKTISAVTVCNHGCTLIVDLHTCSCCVFSSRYDSSIPKNTPQH
jgi:hypothetical protein